MALRQVSAFQLSVSTALRTVESTVERSGLTAQDKVALAGTVEQARSSATVAVAQTREAVLPVLSTEMARLGFVLNNPRGLVEPDLVGPTATNSKVMYVLQDPPLPATAGSAAYADASHRAVVTPGEPSAKPRQQYAPTCLFNAVMAGIHSRRPRWFDRAVRRDAHAGFVSARVPGREYLMFDTLPVRTGSDSLVLATADDGTTTGAFLEKAWAASESRYGSAPVEQALQWFTGNGTELKSSELSDDYLGELATDPDLLAIVWVTTPEDDEPDELLADHNVYAGHAYFLESRNADQTFAPHNPWGHDHPKPPTAKALRTMFPNLAWAHLRDLRGLTTPLGKVAAS